MDTSCLCRATSTSVEITVWIHHVYVELLALDGDNCVDTSCLCRATSTSMEITVWIHHVYVELLALVWR